MLDHVTDQHVGGALKHGVTYWSGLFTWVELRFDSLRDYNIVYNFTQRLPLAQS